MPGPATDLEKKYCQAIKRVETLKQELSQKRRNVNSARARGQLNAEYAVKELDVLSGAGISGFRDNGNSWQLETPDGDVTLFKGRTPGQQPGEDATKIYRDRDRLEVIFGDTPPPAPPAPEPLPPEWRTVKINEPFYVEDGGEGRRGIVVEVNHTNLEDVGEIRASGKRIGYRKILAHYNKKYQATKDSDVYEAVTNEGWPAVLDEEVDDGTRDVTVADNAWYLPKRPGSKVLVRVTVSTFDVDMMPDVTFIPDMATVENNEITLKEMYSTTSGPQRLYYSTVAANKFMQHGQNADKALRHNANEIKQWAKDYNLDLDDEANKFVEAHFAINKVIQENALKVPDDESIIEFYVDENFKIIHIQITAPDGKVIPCRSTLSETTSKRPLSRPRTSALIFNLTHLGREGAKIGVNDAALMHWSKFTQTYIVDAPEVKPSAQKKTQTKAGPADDKNKKKLTPKDIEKAIKEHDQRTAVTGKPGLKSASQVKAEKEEVDNPAFKKLASDIAKYREDYVGDPLAGCAFLQKTIDKLALGPQTDPRAAIEVLTKIDLTMLIRLSIECLMNNIPDIDIQRILCRKALEKMIANAPEDTTSIIVSSVTDGLTIAAYEANLVGNVAGAFADAAGVVGDVASAFERETLRVGGDPGGIVFQEMDLETGETRPGPVRSISSIADVIDQEASIVEQQAQVAEAWVNRSRNRIRRITYESFLEDALITYWDEVIGYITTEIKLSEISQECLDGFFVFLAGVAAADLECLDISNSETLYDILDQLPARADYIPRGVIKMLKCAGFFEDKSPRKLFTLIFEKVDFVDHIERLTGLDICDIWDLLKRIPDLELKDVQLEVKPGIVMPKIPLIEIPIIPTFDILAQIEIAIKDAILAALAGLLLALLREILLMIHKFCCERDGDLFGLLDPNNILPPGLPTIPEIPGFGNWGPQFLDDVAAALTVPEFIGLMDGSAGPDVLAILDTLMPEEANGIDPGDVFRPLSKFVDPAKLQQEDERCQRVALSICELDDMELREELTSGRLPRELIDDIKQKRQDRLNDLLDLLDDTENDNLLDGLPDAVDNCKPPKRKRKNNNKKSRPKQNSIIPRDPPSVAYMNDKVLNVMYEGVDMAFNEDITSFHKKISNAEEMTVDAEIEVGVGALSPLGEPLSAGVKVVPTLSRREVVAPRLRTALESEDVTTIHREIDDEFKISFGGNIPLEYRESRPRGGNHSAEIVVDLGPGVPSMQIPVQLRGFSEVDTIQRHHGAGWPSPGEPGFRFGEHIVEKALAQRAGLPDGRADSLSDQISRTTYYDFRENITKLIFKEIAESPMFGHQGEASPWQALQFVPSPAASFKNACIKMDASGEGNGLVKFDGLLGLQGMKALAKELYKQYCSTAPPGTPGNDPMERAGAIVAMLMLIRVHAVEFLMKTLFAASRIDLGDSVDDPIMIELFLTTMLGPRLDNSSSARSGGNLLRIFGGGAPSEDLASEVSPLNKNFKGFQLSMRKYLKEVAKSSGEEIGETSRWRLPSPLGGDGTVEIDFSSANSEQGCNLWTPVEYFAKQQFKQASDALKVVMANPIGPGSEQIPVNLADNDVHTSILGNMPIMDLARQGVLTSRFSETGDARLWRPRFVNPETNDTLIKRHERDALDFQVEAARNQFEQLLELGMIDLETAMEMTGRASFAVTTGLAKVFGDTFDDGELIIERYLKITDKPDVEFLVRGVDLDAELYDNLAAIQSRADSLKGNVNIDAFEDYLTNGGWMTRARNPGIIPDDLHSRLQHPDSGHWKARAKKYFEKIEICYRLSYVQLGTNFVSGWEPLPHEGNALPPFPKPEFASHPWSWALDEQGNNLEVRQTYDKAWYVTEEYREVTYRGDNNEPEPGGVKKRANLVIPLAEIVHANIITQRTLSPGSFWQSGIEKWRESPTDVERERWSHSVGIGRKAREGYQGGGIHPLRRPPGRSLSAAVKSYDVPGAIRKLKNSADYQYLIGELVNPDSVLALAATYCNAALSVHHPESNRAFDPTKKALTALIKTLLQSGQYGSGAGDDAAAAGGNAAIAKMMLNGDFAAAGEAFGLDLMKIVMETPLQIIAGVVMMAEPIIDPPAIFGWPIVKPMLCRTLPKKLKPIRDALKCPTPGLTDEQKDAAKALADAYSGDPSTWPAPCGDDIGPEDDEQTTYISDTREEG